jgi:hypothetical protein
MRSRSSSEIAASTWKSSQPLGVVVRWPDRAHYVDAQLAWSCEADDNTGLLRPLDTKGDKQDIDRLMAARLALGGVHQERTGSKAVALEAVDITGTMSESLNHALLGRHSPVAQSVERVTVNH